MINHFTGSIVEFGIKLFVSAVFVLVCQLQIKPFEEKFTLSLLGFFAPVEKPCDYLLVLKFQIFTANGVKLLEDFVNFLLNFNNLVLEKDFFRSLKIVLDASYLENGKPNSGIRNILDDEKSKNKDAKP